LVAASTDRLAADTHWLRADVDQFLCELAEELGAETYLGCAVRCELDETGAVIHGALPSGTPARCDFVIDATGGSGRILGGQTPIRDVTHEVFWEAELDGLFHGSRALFAHFENVVPWADVLQEQGISQTDHPFPCDDAALHHVLEEGWMWQLRFDNGVVSAGFALDTSTCPLDEQLSPAQEWQRLLARYPSIARQLAQAKLVAPLSGWQRTGRLQRCVKSGGGHTWALLPHGIGFIDPLHSTGIAHTLSGIERLIPLVLQSPSAARTEQLEDYGNAVLRELRLVLGMVGLCYATRHDPILFEAVTMLYFAAVITCEQSRTAGGTTDSFLNAENPFWLKQVHWLAHELKLPPQSRLESSRLAQQVAKKIAPYNTAGLLDPAARRMYRHTLVQK
jgi:FADH2 O2-dependent halogenase